MPTTGTDPALDYPNASDIPDGPGAFLKLANDITAGFTARALHTYKWANAAGRTGQLGMVAGDMGYQVDTNVAYMFGTQWLPYVPAFAATTGKTSGLPVGSQVLEKFERVSGTTNASSVLAVTFPTAFPNGVLGIFFSTNTGSASTPVLNSDTLSVSGFQVVVPSTPSTLVTFSYLAKGW